MSHVDWDLLADHLGGALAGSTEGDRVARLVATDPGWARAAEELATALDAVALDLSSTPPPPMPEDVAARLDAVLRDLPPGGAEPATVVGPAAGTGSTAVGSTTVGSTAVGGSTAIGARPATAPPGAPAGTTGPAGRRPGRQRSRRRAVKWGAGAAASAGVLVVAALGIGSLGLLPGGFTANDSESATVQEDGLAGDAAPPQITVDDGQAPLTASGADYYPDSPLLRGEPFPAGPLQPERAEEHDYRVEDAGPAQLPGELDRIWSDPQACLAAVAAVHEPAPGVVQRADFAYFDGEPAVVIWVTTSDGGQWVWVAGPDCGTPDGGPDERYQRRVG